MARNAALIPLVPPPQQSTFPLASYSTTYATAPDQKVGPRIVPWSRVWGGGGPPTPSSINLAGVALFAQVSTIYIDNTNCPFQINVDFAQGTPTIICPAGGSGWFPVLVNSLTCVVSAINGIPGRTGTTSIWFANFIVPPVYLPPVPDTIYPSWRFFQFSQAVNPVTYTGGAQTFSFPIGTPNYGCFLKRLQFDVIYQTQDAYASAPDGLLIYFGGVLIVQKSVVYTQGNANYLTLEFDYMDLEALSPVPAPLLSFVFPSTGLNYIAVSGVATCQDTPQLNN